MSDHDPNGSGDGYSDLSEADLQARLTAGVADGSDTGSMGGLELAGSDPGECWFEDAASDVDPWQALTMTCRIMHVQTLVRPVCLCLHLFIYIDI